MESQEERKKISDILEKFSSVVAGDAPLAEEILRLSHIFGGGEADRELVAHLEQHAWGEHALRTFPRLGPIELENLSHFPEGSLGEAYASHLHENKIILPDPLSVIDTRSYVVAHLVETHELWHVVTCIKSDAVGESGLDGFYLAQLNPSATLTANFCKNLLRMAVNNPSACDILVASAVNGWLLGKRAKPLFGFEWNKYWNHRVEEVQMALSLPPQGAKSRNPFTAIQEILHEEMYSLPLVANIARPRHPPLSDL